MYEKRLVHIVVEKEVREEKVKINVVEARLENAVEIETARLQD